MAATTIMIMFGAERNRVCRARVTDIANPGGEQRDTARHDYNYKTGTHSTNLQPRAEAL